MGTHGVVAIMGSRTVTTPGVGQGPWAWEVQPQEGAGSSAPSALPKCGQSYSQQGQPPTLEELAITARRTLSQSLREAAGLRASFSPSFPWART